MRYLTLKRWLEGDGVVSAAASRDRMDPRTIAAVHAFYDSYTEELQGTRNVVTRLVEGVRESRQKRLRTHTYKELHACFRRTHPARTVSLNKFRLLCPWYVRSGSARIRRDPDPPMDVLRAELVGQRVAEAQRQYDAVQAERQLQHRQARVAQEAAASDAAHGSGGVGSAGAAAGGYNQQPVSQHMHEPPLGHMVAQPAAVVQRARVHDTQVVHGGSVGVGHVDHSGGQQGSVTHLVHTHLGYLGAEPYPEHAVTAGLEQHVPLHLEQQAGHSGALDIATGTTQVAVVNVGIGTVSAPMPSSHAVVAMAQVGHPAPQHEHHVPLTVTHASVGMGAGHAHVHAMPTITTTTTAPMVNGGVGIATLGADTGQRGRAHSVPIDLGAAQGLPLTGDGHGAAPGRRAPMPMVHVINNPVRTPLDVVRRDADAELHSRRASVDAYESSALVPTGSSGAIASAAAGGTVTTTAGGPPAGQA